MRRMILVLVGLMLLAGSGLAEEKYFYSGEALNRMTWKMDSLKTSLCGPTPVTVSENVVFTGLDLQSTAAGSTSNLNKIGGGNASRIFPVAGAADVHGAKALYLVLDWVTFKKGYFKIEHMFGASASDTVFNYYDGSVWAFNDSVVVNDSTGVGALTGMAAGAGTLVLRIPDVPASGYYYCRITARDKVHLNSIKTMNGTLVVVQ
jgi:hypothetical protein